VVLLCGFTSAVVLGLLLVRMLVFMLFVLGVLCLDVIVYAGFMVGLMFLWCVDVYVGVYA
jgi:hypothetical protein